MLSKGPRNVNKPYTRCLFRHPFIVSFRAERKEREENEGYAGEEERDGELVGKKCTKRRRKNKKESNNVRIAGK